MFNLVALKSRLEATRRLFRVESRIFFNLGQMKRTTPVASQPLKASAPHLGGRLTLVLRFNVYQAHIHYGSLGESGLKPGTPGPEA
ncbi:hypothetical protein AVEN_179480-1 [Araneus ventricosus]|uniref:Uncharacterized protein n=1 Tax=Araneus ventricosus TaxID=182803 RepID=A0A4Y2BE79_ARAVE|nr:hypothetical protein AVEN_179480-1 [Araneus ventricosus]